MEGTCDLECWCHVPTRGRSKPPCYLCVVQVCSQSYKSSTSPSAPPHSLEEDLEATAPPLQDVLTEASAGNFSKYGEYFAWRPTAPSEGVAERPTTPTQDTEDLRQNTDSYLHLQSHHDEGAVGGVPVNLEATQDFDSDGYPSDDLESRVEGRLLHQVASESTQSSGRGTPSGAENGEARDLSHDEGYSDEDSGITRLNEEENTEKWDLSERIRSLVLGVDDGPCHDPDVDQVSVRQKSGYESHSLERGTSTSHCNHHRPGDQRPERHMTSRVGSSRPHLPRDKTKNFRPSQPFFKFNSVMREKEYQKINRIIRRETSSEAARRYIQRAESLPRRRLRHTSQQGLIANPTLGGGRAGLPDTLDPMADYQRQT